MLDSCCVRARIVVEIDGAHHAEQSAADDHHDQIIERYGFRVLRFGNEDVLTDFPRVFAAIAVACQQNSLT